MTIRIAVHDFIGHAFPVQLSRYLAARNHDVLHLHFPAFQTPKGPLDRTSDDPDTLAIASITLDGSYAKYSVARRLCREAQYVRKCARLIAEFDADVVLSGNCPPYMQHGLRHLCQGRGIRFITWMQDLYGLGVGQVLRRKFGPITFPIGHAFDVVDNALVERSDAVVFIAQEFAEHFEQRVQKGTRCRWHVIENWAPLDELPLRPRVNQWSTRQCLDGKQVLLYSGTLGLKHNPELLVQLAEHFKSNPHVIVVVVSEGLGRSFLERRKQELGLANLKLLDFQPFEDLPDVIASADILIAILERGAGAYSVPSKVLTYLCAKRPLLLSVPMGNLAARLVSSVPAGIVVEPDDSSGFIGAADQLLSRHDVASMFASQARDYALTTFDINGIGCRFEEILTDTVSRGGCNGMQRAMP